MHDITKEMLADWRHADGWRDFNGALDGYLQKDYPYGDGIAILRYEEGELTGVAVHATAKIGRTFPKRKYCPVWLSPDENSHIIADVLRLPTMIEPEFSLDEMEVAEELLRG